MNILMQNSQQLKKDNFKSMPLMLLQRRYLGRIVEKKIFLAKFSTSIRVVKLLMM
jgi:hypothetical protein